MANVTHRCAPCVGFSSAIHTTLCEGKIQFTSTTATPSKSPSITVYRCPNCVGSERKEQKPLQLLHLSCMPQLPFISESFIQIPQIPTRSLYSSALQPLSVTLSRGRHCARKPTALAPELERHVEDHGSPIPLNSTEKELFEPFKGTSAPSWLSSQLPMPLEIFTS